MKKLDKRFDTERKCLDFLMSQKTQEQKICKKCKREFKNFVQSEMRFSCSCGNKLNPKVGTMFENTKLSLVTGFTTMQMFAYSTNGITTMFVHKLLKITYTAAGRMCKKIKKNMHEIFEIGDDATIMIDETEFGGKEKNKPEIIEN